VGGGGRSGSGPGAATLGGPWRAWAIRSRIVGMVRILHLSDLHFRASDQWQADPVLEALRRDAVATWKGRVDLLIVTGDIAFSGKKAEYELANAWLEALISELGLERARVVLAPGNHDVDRGTINETGTSAEGRFREATEERAGRWLESNKDRASLFQRSRAWLLFAQRWGGGQEPWGPRDFPELDTHVAVLDSALLSSGDKDRGRLRLTEYQLRAATRAWEARAHRVVAAHHPVDYLVEADRPHLAIVGKASLWLQGHLHEPDVVVEQRLGARLVRVSGGSAYAGSVWSNSYSLIELDGEVRGHVRSWVNARQEWVPHATLFPPDGTWTTAQQVIGDPRVTRADPGDAPWRARMLLAADQVPRIFQAPGHTFTQVRVAVHVGGVEARDPDHLGRLARGAFALELVLDAPGARWEVVGAPGCGKTSLLFHVARVALDRGILPVLVRVPDLERGFDEAIRAVEPGSLPAVVAAAEQGRAVLLVDGRDEAVDPERASVAIRALAGRFPGCPLVVTGRDTDHAPLPGFSTYAVCPLGTDEQKALLGKWLPDDRVAGVFAAMHATARLARLAENPLLLTMVAFVARDGPLPRSRAAIYARAVWVLLTGASRDRGVAEPEATLAWLARAAREAHVGSGWFVPFEVFRRAHGGSEADARRALAEVVDRTGLLVPDGPLRHAPRFAFVHRTIREYLASWALRGEGPSEVVLAAAAARVDDWVEVLGLVVGAEGARAADWVGAIAARGVPALTFRVLADAEGLPPAVVEGALGLAPGREAWEKRCATIRELPEATGDLRVAVEVAWRFAHGTTHGAELWHVQDLIDRVALGLSGTVAEGTAEGLRARCRTLCVVDLPHLQARRQEARALLAPWWREIPAGETQIGSPDDDAEAHLILEKPATDVWVGAFQLAAVPVTNAMYACLDPAHETASSKEFAKHPVTGVSWWEAVFFAEWVGCRLPSSIEWERACRAGTRTRYWCGDRDSDLSAVAWYPIIPGNRKHAVTELPSPRGLRHPYGLLYMPGYVSEWTLSAGIPGYADLSRNYAPEQSRHMSGDLQGDWRTIRGGAFGIPRRSRSAWRSGWRPMVRRDDLGFRLVRLPASCTALER
jgi:formylglycine-generating enzyme required for sulfatase activity/predicted MPP superfamily phosphohydrolase